jgi:hypothetical protein
MDVYDRSMQFDEYGNLRTSNLEGVIDANKLLLMGG